MSQAAGRPFGCREDAGQARPNAGTHRGLGVTREPHVPLELLETHESTKKRMGASYPRQVLQARPLVSAAANCAVRGLLSSGAPICLPSVSLSHGSL